MHWSVPMHTINGVRYPDRSHLWALANGICSISLDTCKHLNVLSIKSVCHNSRQLLHCRLMRNESNELGLCTENSCDFMYLEVCTERKQMSAMIGHLRMNNLIWFWEESKLEMASLSSLELFWQRVACRLPASWWYHQSQFYQCACSLDLCVKIWWALPG